MSICAKFVIGGIVVIVAVGGVVAGEGRQKYDLNMAFKCECGPDDFNSFVEAFSENSKLQVNCTNWPLKKTTIGGTEAAPAVVKGFYKFREVKFPVLPSKKERAAGAVNFLMERESESVVEMSLRSHVGDKKSLIYVFEKKRQCWSLTGIEDWSLPSSFKSSWLANIFPKMTACTPTELYFDKEKYSSNDGFLEKIGYIKPVVKGNFAEYDISEIFFGLSAVKLTIPVGYFSEYMIDVEAPPMELVKKIRLATGIIIKIHKDIEMTSGEAYIVSKPNGGSVFVCSTSEN